MGLGSAVRTAVILWGNLGQRGGNATARKVVAPVASGWPTTHTGIVSQSRRKPILAVGGNVHAAIL